MNQIFGDETMNHNFTSFDRMNKIKAIEDNINSFLEIWKYVPHSTFKKNRKGVQIVTGVPYAFLNSVANVKLPANNAEREVKEFLQPYIDNKLPVLWWLCPSSKPGNLGDILEKFGLKKIDTFPGMAMDLTKLDYSYSFPEGLSVKLVSNELELQDWCKAFHSGFGMPREREELFLKADLAVMSSIPDQFLRFVGYWDGEPIASSAVVLDNGLAGVYLVTTHPEHRKKGIGTIMTVKALEEAKARNFKIGVLQSTKMGYHIYKNIGFDEFCTVDWYHRSWKDT